MLLMPIYKFCTEMFISRTHPPVQVVATDVHLQTIFGRIFILHIRLYMDVSSVHQPTIALNWNTNETEYEGWLAFEHLSWGLLCPMFRHWMENVRDLHHFLSFSFAFALCIYGKCVLFNTMCSLPCGLCKIVRTLEWFQNTYRTFTTKFNSSFPVINKECKYVMSA